MVNVRPEKGGVEVFRKSFRRHFIKEPAKSLSPIMNHKTAFSKKTAE